MTISAENVFGPKARSTRTGASHVVRVDRGATRECAEVRETQSRRVICRYSCPMLQMGLLRAAAGATDAFAASAASQTDARPCADANVRSPAPPLAGKALRASPQGVSPNLPNCQISLDQRSSDGKTPRETPLDAFRQLSCGPNSLPPARTTQSSLELS